MNGPDPALVFVVVLAFIVLIIAGIAGAIIEDAKKKQAPKEKPPAEQAETAVVLIEPPPPPPVVALPQLESPVVTPDIETLLGKAFSNFQVRSRTLREWLANVDVRDQQLAEKLKAAGDARKLIEGRTDLIRAFRQLFAEQAEFRKQQLAAYAEVLDLQAQVNDRLLAHQQRQARALEPAPVALPEPVRVLAEHRREREARVRAGEEMLDDFLREVELICNSRSSIHARALRLRSLLGIFEMGEETLPADARWILRTADRMIDGD